MATRGRKIPTGVRGLRLAVAVLSLVVVGCGGGGSSTGPTTVPATVVARTVTVLSGESGLAVAGARVVVGGGDYVTNAAGQATVAGSTSPQAATDLLADGFLDRNTHLTLGPVFTLWPKTSPNGLDEPFSMMAVYTSWPRCLEEPERPGERALWRPRQGTRFALVPSAEILADPPSMAAQLKAIELANEAVGDVVSFTLGESVPPGALRIDLRIDPDIDCDQAAAVNRGNEYAYCAVRIARRWQTAVHEIGHSLGMQHHPKDGWRRGDIMSCYGSWAPEVEPFSARERLAVRLMFQRPVGNRWPDRDGVVGTSVGFAPFECG